MIYLIISIVLFGIYCIWWALKVMRIQNIHSDEIDKIKKELGL